MKPSELILALKDMAEIWESRGRYCQHFTVHLFLIVCFKISSHLHLILNLGDGAISISKHGPPHTLRKSSITKSRAASKTPFYTTNRKELQDINFFAYHILISKWSHLYAPHPPRFAVRQSFMQLLQAHDGLRIAHEQ